MIRAEVQIKTKEGKTPNCAACDQPAYWKFVSEGNVRFSWRKCGYCMDPEERQAVRNTVLVIGDMNL